MEPLPAGLLLLAVTTPAIIAYRHPKEFRRLGWVFLLVGGIVLLCLGSWQIGYGQGVGDAFDFLAPSAPVAREDFAKHSLNVGLVDLYLMGAMLYVWLLMGLPYVGLVKKGE